MGTRLRVCAIAGVLLYGVILRAETPQRCQRSDSPSNMEISRDVSRVLQPIYEKSPTFRAQCARLASARNLRVIVRLDPGIPGRFRAFTVIQREGREIRADVHLPPGRALIELVAHEFEHLLEQVEGVNLRKLARMRATGVREIESEIFETDRAQRAGRRVADEVAGESRTPSAD